jgi:hypothetical protein
MSWGYLSAEYAEALGEFGEPKYLGESCGWLLQRLTLCPNVFDAMGCYPIFTCANWSALKHDLISLEGQLVSVIVVTDPFGDYDEHTLRESFPDLMRPFKKHYVVDLRSEYEKAISLHHRRNIRKANDLVSVDRAAPGEALNDWNMLYDNLINRHGIKGFARFSHASFALQLRVPGVVIFRATSHGETVGMTLWFANDRLSYYHLGAYSDSGYERCASYLMFREALEYFAKQGLRYVDLGAGAGVTDDVSDGLSRFKRGWANSARTAYLCGRILDRNRYDEIGVVKGAHCSDYFPTYRAGEFD